MQHQIIDICGEIITKKIVSEVKEAKYSSIVGDEATDCANIEQIVDRSSNICKEFLGFVQCMASRL